MSHAEQLTETADLYERRAAEATALATRVEHSDPQLAAYEWGRSAALTAAAGDLRRHARHARTA
jgi:hypothetical protein